MYDNFWGLRFIMNRPMMNRPSDETSGWWKVRRWIVRFGVKLRRSVCAVSGAPLSSSGLEEAL